MCPETSTRVPIQCPLGFYSAANSVSCKKCEGGYQCPDPRASSRTLCDANFFSFEGATHCFMCPAGKKCTQAAADTGILKVGEAIIEKCAPGEYSDEG